MKDMPIDKSIQNRQIRVFISSTFKDMRMERDYLVKFIFPQLRKLCESRGVIWGEVDLRWGVTDEQVAEGKVLPTCLEEIKRCQPYFLGLLGERYGWIPNEIPDDLIEREPWLKEHLHGKTSITELEILHGVLRNPGMAGHAYFYFRDPAYADAIHEKERGDFAASNIGDAEKLMHLKDTIRRSGFPVHENYPNPQALGNLVLTDLTRVINDLFPDGSQPAPLDREAMDHEAYAQSRRRVYVGRQQYFDRLNTHATASDPRPLVILGEAGSGKTALLANWVVRYRQMHPDTLMLHHYIGATPYSADWAAMLRRLMREFKRRFAIQQDIPEQSDALRSVFPDWLYMAAAKGRVVLVLDALNQLEDRDGALDLVWLPLRIPENVRIVVSTLPGRTLDEIEKRNWPTLKVELLSPDERRKLITEYLAQYAKSLSPLRVERIVAAPPASNPLYVRALLDELRLISTHEELEERINDYLKAKAPNELYDKIIARWEDDYGQDLVRQSLSLIWAARRGLSEAELLDLLGKDGQQLPRATWTPYYLSAESSLVSQCGLLTFSHGYVSESVAKRYFQSENVARCAHEVLADYFSNQPLLFRFQNEQQNIDVSPFFAGSAIPDALDHIAPRPYNRRKIEEQPWQTRIAKEWRKLSLLMSDLMFFQAVWDYQQDDVEAFWKVLHAQTEFTMPKAYETVILNPEKFASRLLWAIGRLLSENRYPCEAVAIQQCLIHRTKDNTVAHILAVSNFAQTLSRLNETDHALEIVNKVLGDMAQSDISFATAPLLFEIGRIHYDKDNFKEAIHYLREASLLCRTGMHWSEDLLGQILVYRAIAHGRIGEIDTSLRLSTQGVNELRCCQSRKLLAWALSVNGLIHKNVGDPDAAFEAWGEARDIYEELQDHTATENISKQISSLGINKKRESKSYE